LTFDDAGLANPQGLYSTFRIPDIRSQTGDTPCQATAHARYAL